MILTAATTTGRTEWDFWVWLVDRFTGPGLGNTVIILLFGAIAVLTLIQAFTKKKPWSAIAHAVGNAMNHDIIEADEQLKAQIESNKKETADQIQAVSDELHERDKAIGNRLDKLTDQVTANQKANEDARGEDKALQARTRTIRFADECRQGTRHSKEMFEQTLDDISFYKEYCRTHEKFPNDKANASIKLVEDRYDECLREDDFE